MPSGLRRHLEWAPSTLSGLIVPIWASLPPSCTSVFVDRVKSGILLVQPLIYNRELHLDSGGSQAGVHSVRSSVFLFCDTKSSSSILVPAETLQPVSRLWFVLTVVLCLAAWLDHSTLWSSVRPFVLSHSCGLRYNILLSSGCQGGLCTFTSTPAILKAVHRGLFAIESLYKAHPLQNKGILATGPTVHVVRIVFVSPSVRIIRADCSAIISLFVRGVQIHGRVRSFFLW